MKCAQYWPSPALGSITYGDIDVKLDNVAELRDYIVRNFTVTHVSHAILGVLGISMHAIGYGGFWDRGEWPKLS